MNTRPAPRRCTLGFESARSDSPYVPRIGADPGEPSGDVPTVGGERRVLTQRHERRIVEQHLLDAIEDSLLRRIRRRVEPFLSQRFDLGLLVPPGPAFFADAADEEI